MTDHMELETSKILRRARTVDAVEGIDAFAERPATCFTHT